MQKGVKGVIVTNGEGVPIKTTMDHTKTILYTALVTQLCDKGRSAVKDLDPSNDLTFLRLRSRMQEIMIAVDFSYLLIVVQAAVEEEGGAAKKAKGSDEEGEAEEEKEEEEVEKVEEPEDIDDYVLELSSSASGEADDGKHADKEESEDED
ncbi:hypothetical protein GE061_005817 [Apolygus lucorum]|uniref:Roadblock/LAMTOR2 domain-containing protein n=1 Tax=Apolygus lucorum TaxID=248454 RepID=A0A8S9WYS3_APOLU|nr:hypothetical protein GE061_005817 [Apolygus lucorum]